MNKVSIPLAHQIASLGRAVLFGNAAIALAVMAYDKYTSRVNLTTDQVMAICMAYTAFCLFIMAFGGLFWMSAAVHVAASSLGSAVGAAFGQYYYYKHQYSQASNPTVLKPIAARNEAAEAVSYNAPIVDRYMLNNTLHFMVERANKGMNISRNTMVALSLCSQNYWNLANYILCAVGLRDPASPSRYYSTGGVNRDLHWLSTHYTVEDGQVMVKPKDTELWEIVDLERVHFLKKKPG